MRLSNRQAMILVAVLKDVLYISNGSFGGYSQEQLVAIYNEIINQQDGVVREIAE